MKCGIEKEESEFPRDKSRKDGLGPRCKRCTAEYSRLYRVENKDKIAEYRCLRYAANKDLILNQHREYNLENRAVINERAKENRAMNQERCNKYSEKYCHRHPERRRESNMRYNFKSRHPMNPTTITDPIIMGKASDMRQLGMRVIDIAEKLSVEGGKRITQMSLHRLFASQKKEPIPELLESDYPSLQDISYIFNIKFKKEKTATVITYHNTTMRRDVLQRILTKFYNKNFTYDNVKHECNDRDTDTAFLDHWEYLLHFHYIEHITDTEFGFCDIVKRWHMKVL